MNEKETFFIKLRNMKNGPHGPPERLLSKRPLKKPKNTRRRPRNRAGQIREQVHFRVPDQKDAERPEEPRTAEAPSIGGAASDPSAAKVTAEDPPVGGASGPSAAKVTAEALSIGGAASGPSAAKVTAEDPPVGGASGPAAAQPQPDSPNRRIPEKGIA